MADIFGDSLGRLPLALLNRRPGRLTADFGHGVGLESFNPALSGYSFQPDAELHEHARQTTIRVDLPGVERNDIDISATDNVIEISGSKADKSEVRDGDRYHSERSYGTFYRAFALPFAIDCDKVVAKLDKGVLTVTVPATTDTRAKARKIAIAP